MASVSTIMSGISGLITMVDSCLKFFSNPTQTVLKTIRKRHEIEKNLTRGLLQFKPNTLEEVGHRLASEKEQIYKRVNLTIGALDKVGIIRCYR